MKEKLNSKNVLAFSPMAKPFEVFDTEIKGFLVRVEPSGTRTYYLAYTTQAGKRRRYKLGKVGVTTITQARDEAIKRLGEVAQGKDPSDELKAQREAEKATKKEINLTLEHFIEDHYKPWAEANLKSHKDTLHKLSSGFRGLQKKPLAELTAFDFERNRQDRLKKPLPGRKNPPSIASTNRELATMKAALTRAVEWGLIPANPAKSVKLRKVDRNKAPRFLSEEEESRMLAALRARDAEKREKWNSHQAWMEARDMPSDATPLPEQYIDYLEPLIITALNTGMRRGEMLGLHWDNVHIDREHPVISVVGDGAKSGRTRHIPLSKAARETLGRWKSQGEGIGLVFPKPDTGQRMHDVNTSFENLLEKAKITGFRFHDLRHTFASRLRQRGASLDVIRDLLGHSDYKLTLIYAHLRPEDTANAVALLDGKPEATGEIIPFEGKA